MSMNFCDFKGSKVKMCTIYFNACNVNDFQIHVYTRA